MKLMYKYNYTVYKHITPSGKIYVGITCQPPEHRWNHGRGYFNLPKSPLKSAILKYGWDSISHVIMATGLAEMTAKIMEMDFIAFYKKQGISLNITDGGDGFRGLTPWNKGRKDLSGVIGPKPGCVLSEDHKFKLRKPHGGNSGWRLGIRDSKEHREKLSKAHLGFKVSEETKAKISAHSALAVKTLFIDTVTEEVLEFQSCSKLAEFLNIKDPSFLCKHRKRGTLYKGRYKIQAISDEQQLQ